MAARTADGLEDWTTSTAGEREQILAKWNEIQPNIKKVNTHGEKPVQRSSTGHSSLCHGSTGQRIPNIDETLA